MRVLSAGWAPEPSGREAERPAWPGAVVGRVWTVLFAGYSSRWRSPAAAFLLATVSILMAGRSPTLPVPVALAASLASTVPLAVAHRFPAFTLPLVLTANAVFIVLGRLSWPITAIGSWLFALGLCPILLPRKPAFAAFAACEVVVLFAALASTPANYTPWDASLAETLAVATAWGAGESLRYRHRTATERAKAAALVQQLRERDAVARERAAIARELHDVIAHHVSIVAVRAATAPYSVPNLPEPARAAFAEIADQARTTMEELRAVLGVLRAGDDSADRAPQSQLTDVPDLVERMRAAGTQAAVEVTGAVRMLAAPLELCAYRVVQESLTNARRHAPGSRALVRLDYADDALVVTVRDDGSSGAPAGPSGADELGGFGLIGMRERVALLGGQFDAGPDPSGGFAVVARLPIQTADALIETVALEAAKR